MCVFLQLCLCFSCASSGYIKDSQQYNRDAEGHICSHFLAYGVDGRAEVITFLLLSFSVWQLWPTLSLSSSDACVLSSVSLHSPGLSSLSKASGSHCLAILSYRCADPSFGCFQLCFGRHLVLGKTANWDTDSKRSLSNGASLWGENSKQTIEQGERMDCVIQEERMGSEFTYYASQIVSDIRISASPIIVHFLVGFCSLHQCMLFQLMLPQMLVQQKRRFLWIHFLMVPKEDHEFFKLWFLGLET